MTDVCVIIDMYEQRQQNEETMTQRDQDLMTLISIVIMSLAFLYFMGWVVSGIFIYGIH